MTTEGGGVLECKDAFRDHSNPWIEVNKNLYYCSISSDDCLRAHETHTPCYRTKIASAVLGIIILSLVIGTWLAHMANAYDFYWHLREEGAYRPVPHFISG